MHMLGKEIPDAQFILGRAPVYLLAKGTCTLFGPDKHLDPGTEGRKEPCVTNIKDIKKISKILKRVLQMCATIVIPLIKLTRKSSL